MSPVDEGLIHAWLDGQLAGDDATRVERLVATDPAWADAAADARGVIAAGSRILGALDDVPRLREDEKMGRPEDEKVSSKTAGYVRRVWWRSPAIRVAAGLVLAAGLARLVWPTRDAVPAAPASTAAQPGDSARTSAAQVAVESSRPPAETPARDKAVLQSAAPASGVGARVATNEIAADSGRGAPVNAPPVVTARPTVGGLAGGGRGGRGAGAVGAAIAKSRADSGQLRALTDLPSQPVAKVLPQTAEVDARLQGCWRAIDSTAEARQRFDETRASGERVLRFMRPVVTDLPSAPPVVAPPAGGGVQQNARLTVINAAYRVLPDSTFVGEWIEPAGRMLIAFSVHADTLRGTRRRSTGDIVLPVVSFVAVRVVCPEAGR